MRQSSEGLQPYAPSGNVDVPGDRLSVAQPMASGFRRYMALKIRGMTPLLQVFDMPRSLQFYCDLLGFAVVDHSAAWDDASHSAPDYVDWAWLRRDTVDLMLNTAYERDTRPLAPDAWRFAAHDDTALYFACPDVDDAFEYLRRCGVQVLPPVVRHYGMRQLSLHDPDGYHLCFQWQA